VLILINRNKRWFWWLYIIALIKSRLNWTTTAKETFQLRCLLYRTYIVLTPRFGAIIIDGYKRSTYLKCNRFLIDLLRRLPSVSASNECLQLEYKSFTCYELHWLPEYQYITIHSNSATLTLVSHPHRLWHKLTYSLAFSA
jgi:hypothetical protein